ncbi:hypothetical protein LSM04_005102 [Trypanosoma melophagium]|uniref:uncharacterized protein n=1 Tax=Trypanosoma melophagium TaxID=715481 RepID=UPI00351A2924|nr:hypothetical protein LSM04_005102 [Trypanosoma melophagium]
MSPSVIIGCCASFTLIAGIVLLIFAALMLHNSWTFEVIAAKQEWDLVEKAGCCRNAGIFYMSLSLLLWLWISLRTILGNKCHSQCNFWPFSRSSDFTDPVMEGDDWSSHNSETHQFSREVAPLLKRSSHSLPPLHNPYSQPKQRHLRDGM